MCRDGGGQKGVRLTGSAASVCTLRSPSVTGSPWPWPTGPERVQGPVCPWSRPGAAGLWLVPGVGGAGDVRGSLASRGCLARGHVAKRQDRRDSEVPAGGTAGLVLGMVLGWAAGRPLSMTSGAGHGPAGCSRVCREGWAGHQGQESGCTFWHVCAQEGDEVMFQGTGQVDAEPPRAGGQDRVRVSASSPTEETQKRL